MEQALPTTDLVWRDLSGGIREFILRRIGGDDDSADDILQDVFLKVHTRIDTLHNQDRLESWIYQIVRNTINDYFRGQRPQAEVPDELPAPEPDAPDLAQQLIPSVRSMIKRLPAHYREAIMLTEYQGLTQREMAEKLGISLSGAKSRVQRARDKLRDMLLDCCHFEIDRRGKIIDYSPRCDCCTGNGNLTTLKPIKLEDKRK